MLDLVMGLIVGLAILLFLSAMFGFGIGHYLGKRKMPLRAAVPFSFGIALVVPLLLIALAIKIASAPLPMGGLGIPTPFFETPMAKARDSIVGELKVSSFVLLVSGWITAQLAAWSAYRSTLKKE